MGRLREERIRREGSPPVQYVVPLLVRDIPHMIDDKLLRDWERYYPFNFSEIVNQSNAILHYSPRPGVVFDIYPFQTKVISEQTVTVAKITTSTVTTGWTAADWNVVINFQRLPTSMDRSVRGIK